MTDLAVVETTLETWAEGLSGLTLEWGRQSMLNHQGPFILAYPGVIDSRGRDEHIWTYDSQTDQNNLKMSGIRYLTVTFSFRSYDQRLGLSSRQFVEDFRVLLESPGSIDTLTAGDLALSGIADLVDTDYTYQRRRISQVDMDLLFGLRFELDDPFWDGSWIKTVNLSSEQYILDENGVPVTTEEGEILTTEASDPFTVTAA